MPGLNAIFRLTDAYTSVIDKIASKTAAATSGIDRASSAADRFNNRLNSAGGMTSGYTSGLSSAGAAAETFDAHTSAAASAAGKFNSQAGNTGNSAGGFNAGLNAMGSSADRLVSKLGTLIKTMLSLEAAKKLMDTTDNYVNTTSRLSLITNNLQQQQQLQNQIFAAAYRSRGAYDALAGSVAKIGVTAGQNFKNNGQIVKFAETMQKMFKIGGTNTQDQAAAMLQLTQALGAGKLQGNDFRAIADDAPLVEKAVAQYLNTSTGKVKQLSTDGKISSQVLINSILKYSQTVDRQFSKMPMTFGDVWNELKTGAAQAFGSVYDNESKALNSTAFQGFVNGAIGSFYVLAQVINSTMNAAGAAGSFFADNWSMIEPIIWGIVGALIVYNATMGVAWLTTLLSAAAVVWKTICDWAETVAIFAMIAAQDGLNAALAACPITWIIIGIIALIVVFYVAIAAVNHFAGTSISATGLIGGAIGVLVAGVYNQFVQMWNIVAAFINFFANVWTHPIASVKALFYDLASTVIGYIETMAKGIQDLINKIPGMKVDITSGLTGLKNNMEKASATVKNQAGLKTYVQSKQFMQYSTAASKGYDIGSKAEKSLNIGNLFSKLSNLGKSNIAKTLATPTGALGTNANPATVKGTGSNGNVNVNMADEDLQYLRDLAEKDFVNKFTSATLAPNISFKFTGAISKDVDTADLSKRVSTILANEIAVTAEGAH